MKNRIQIDFETGFYIYAAIAVLFLPLRWFLAAMGAALFHESGHILLLKMRKIPVNSITVGVGGAKIQTGYQTRVDQILCAAAGPVFGLVSAYLFRAFPEFSICCLVQSLFNLLPFYPFDGGRVLSSICILLLGESKGDVLCRVVQVIILPAIFVFFLYVVFRA